MKLLPSGKPAPTSLAQNPHFCLQPLARPALEPCMGFTDVYQDRDRGSASTCRLVCSRFGPPGPTASSILDPFDDISTTRKEHGQHDAERMSQSHSAMPPEQSNTSPARPPTASCYALAVRRPPSRNGRRLVGRGVSARYGMGETMRSAGI